MSQVVIETINNIFENLFSSIDLKLYEVLDKLTFIDSSILQDKYFEKILGTSASNGLLLLSNSLLIGFVLYFAIKFLTSNITFSRVETPTQFLFKILIYGIAMNCSYFIIQQILDINSDICKIIQSLGEDLFQKKVSFSNLINSINTSLNLQTDGLNVFSVEGIIKGTTIVSLINLVTSYALRYVMIKIFVLLSPFAFLSLCMESTSWFFRVWAKNLFSLLLIQIIVSLVLLILFSIQYDSNNLVTKFVYVGGIYALIKANSFVREFISCAGMSTFTQNGIGFIKPR